MSTLMWRLILRCIFSVPVANSVLGVRLPRSGRCGITHFVGNEAFRETNRAEMVMRRRANLQVSLGLGCHRRREPTPLAYSDRQPGFESNTAEGSATSTDRNRLRR